MDEQAAIANILQRLQVGLPAKLSYHSYAHTLDVLDRVVSLGRAEGVSDEELRLLKVAASYHDAGFLISNRDHERLGCRMAEKDLGSLGFSTEAIETICGMIMATKVPQQAKTTLEEIICDADLDYLGREDFYSIGGRLFSELKAYHLLETEEEWNHLQIQFLSKHTYWTATNIALREPEKQKRLAELAEQWGLPPNQK